MTRQPPLCVFCGKTYEEHVKYYSDFAAIPRVPCLLLKAKFTAKKKAETKD